MTVVLECIHEEPFSDWSDWYPRGDESVVLTFQTMAFQLWETWSMQCVSYDRSGDTPERIVDQTQFDPAELLTPGLHRETYDDPEYLDEVYEIVVPRSILAPAICERWIDRLNETYDRAFELDYDG